MTHSDHSPGASPNPNQQTVVAERLRARRSRVRAIRKRVAGLAVATFLATSGAIFVQLVTGNDPALARKTNAVTGSSSASSTSSPASTGSTASSNGTSASSSSSSASSGSSPSAVTTSAS
jgi:cytoskeletal protein RodZ